MRHSGVAAEALVRLFLALLFATARLKKRDLVENRLLQHHLDNQMGLWGF